MGPLWSAPTTHMRALIQPVVRVRGRASAGQTPSAALFPPASERELFLGLSVGWLAQFKLGWVKEVVQSVD